MLPRFLKSIRKYGIESLTPQFRYSYCCARLALGDFSDYFGWEFRDHENPWAAKLYWDETWLPKWGGGGVNRLLVLGEQGLGDQIFYASIIPEALVRCNEVIYECDHRLHKLLERSLPGLVCRTEKTFEDRRDYGEIDAFIPACDLMRMFRRDRKHFPAKPFLRPDPRLDLSRYAGRTGIAWKGRQGSVDPLSVGSTGLLSVQYRETHPGIESADIDLWNDIESVCALVSVLAEVVTVPQTIHHIAGALGVKTSIVVPDIEGEVVNQIKWDYPVGRLPWYRDATVYANAEEFRGRDR